MKQRLLLLTTVAFIALSTISTTGCQRETYADENTVKLCFSADTVSFDTVFTTLGTATRQVRVYNRSGKDVNLSSVTLAKGYQSRFRLNVDGDTSLVARHIVIQDGDSIFIFIQACINPNGGTSAVIEEDDIVFSNGQRLHLTAWGRDAYYHKRGPNDTTWYYPIDCNTWNTSQHDKPHIIIGTAAVLEGNTLSLIAGDELYFAPDAMLIIDSAASIKVHGSVSQPVLFSSLRRHEQWYASLPGQWQMMWFYNGSTGNIIDHAVIENGTDGIRAYPDAQVNVSNTIIRNMSDAAIVGQNATIDVNNMLVYDCYTSLALIGGGSYSFDYCTLADYWTYRGKTRDTASVIISNYYPLSSSEFYGSDMRQANFSHSIIYGSFSHEVSINLMPGLAMNYHFDNSCLVRGGDWDEDPRFEDVTNDDYRLQNGSPAIGIGYKF